MRQARAFVKVPAPILKCHPGNRNAVIRELVMTRFKSNVRNEIPVRVRFTLSAGMTR